MPPTPENAPSIAEQIRVQEEYRDMLRRDYTITLEGHPMYGKIEEPGIEREIQCIEATIAVLRGIGE